MDLRGNIPIFIDITDGKVHDVNVLDKIEFEADAFYTIDKGYYDFKRLYKLKQADAFYIIRAKRNISFRRIYSRDVNKAVGLKCDQTIKLARKDTASYYPDQLRRIKFFDASKPKTYIFLTNNFELDALTICTLYKNRWQIELFFKWIKQHLEIKVFLGESINAVKTQILSVSLFDKTPLNQPLSNTGSLTNIDGIHNQLKIF